jgi:hypothetical protein
MKENLSNDKYLITFKYENLDLPCINGVFLCSLGEFLKEYKPIYPEIKFDIPNDIINKIGSSNNIGDHCIIMPVNSIMNIDEAVWICHPNIEILTQFQMKLSNIIYDANKLDYTFTSAYINNKKEVVNGLACLKNDAITFNAFDKKIIKKIDWVNVEPYVIALYLKENIVWEGDQDKAPESPRCLKIVAKEDVKSKNADYFCIYNKRNDFNTGSMLDLPQARYTAKMYANKMNVRLQKASIKDSLDKLTKVGDKLEVDSKILFPIKIQIRNEYLKQRHNLITQVKIGKKLRKDVENLLNGFKKKLIEKACNSIELCIRAINYCISKKLFPLTGDKEKFSFDMQNPYHALIPKINIQVDSANNGEGEKIIKTVNKIKGIQDYFTEDLPESNSEIPNNINIMRAINSISQLRGDRQYINQYDLLINCKPSNCVRNVRRKLSFLTYSQDFDPFFDFLGKIRDKQYST